MTTLNEGLRNNDLKGMVRNTISVDEYQSKVDDSAIVLAFYVTDRHAAQDVNRFLQKSHVELLDSEVSVAPDMRGDYLVFVEIPLNAKAAQGAVDLCRDISSLAGFQNWKVRVRGEDETPDLTFDKLTSYIRQKISTLMNAFFQDSDIAESATSDYMQLLHESQQVKFTLADFGTFENVVKRNDLHESAMDLSTAAQRDCRSVKAILGHNWTVEKVGKFIAVYEDSSDKVALLQLL